MRILVITPERKPQIREIPNTLEAMQQVVGGEIEIIYPFDSIALVSNRDGKNLSLPPNRELRDEDGGIYDIVCGTFFLCGAPEDGEDFVSMTDEQLQQYSELFAVPRLFMPLGDRLVILPCKERALTDKEKTENGIRKLWLRLGVTIEITAEEEQTIFGPDESRAEDTLRSIIADGRFVPDGEAYIPAEAVQAFNKEYGTVYEPDNWFYDL